MEAPPVRRWRAALEGPWAEVASSWVAARVVVLLALAFAEVLRRIVLDHHGVHLPHEGLLGWDGQWYQGIADRGYRRMGRESLRFFPLAPLLAPIVGLGSGGAGMLVLANVGAVPYAWLVHRVALREGLGVIAARRAVWVAAFVPTGFVLVMGYTEALYGILVALCFLGARDRRWWLAAAAGALAGATRPTGFLLAVAVLIEACRGLLAVPPRELLARVAAVAAPVVGLLAYLGWVGAVYGDPRLPFRVQQSSGLRGGILYNPFPELWHILSLAVRLGRPFGTSLHLLWVLPVLLLLVVCARRLPASYTVFAVLTVALGLTARRLNSFERYAGGTLSLVLVLSLLLVKPGRFRFVLPVASALLFFYATLAFLGAYVP